MENESLVLDFVEWVEAGPRSYEEVMNTWRTTCPRLSIWEDSVDARLVEMRGDSIHVTVHGTEFLRIRRGNSLKTGPKTVLGKRISSQND